MSKGFMLIDGNSIGYAANAGKKLHAGEDETQAIYGFLRSLRQFTSMFPQLTPVILWDGASWRKNFYKNYKASRDADPKTKAEIIQAQARKAFKQQSVKIREALDYLGVYQVSAFNLEADDLAGIIVRKYVNTDKKILLISGDADWIQLVGPRVSWWDPIRDMRVSPATIKEKCGVASARAWLELKCLKGDTSDEISGVGGIGEKGGKDLLAAYDTVDNFLNRVLDGSINLDDLPKKFADFAKSEEKQDIYKRNLMLMDLIDNPGCPAPINFKMKKGRLDRDKFEAFCENHIFKSILNDPHWCDPFEESENG